MTLMNDNINDIYLGLVRKLFDGEVVGNTRELNNVTVILTDITKNFIEVRDLSVPYLIGELLWYFNGDNTVDFISKFSSFWRRISDDGLTSNSAYGYIMLKKHGFNQIEKVITLLKTDPNSRRAKININTPNIDIITTKDEPCTMSLHFLIRNGKLNCTAVMRSNDIWFGFPYDVAFFTELQKYIADKLGVGYGTYTHFAVSLHMYDRDKETLKQIADDPVCKPITFDREKFYKQIKELYTIAKWYGKPLLLKVLKERGIYDED